MNTFKAIKISKEDTGSQNVAYRDMMDTDLMDGNVDVRVSHSTINYKDGLVLSGKSAVVTLELLQEKTAINKAKRGRAKINLAFWMGFVLVWVIIMIRFLV